MSDIINRVANSKLVTFDLEELYPPGERILLDIKDWLYEGLVLREKEFRTHVSNHEWEQYSNCFVAIICSADAIVPGWAYMLIASNLQPFVHKSIQGNLEQLESAIYQDLINDLDVSDYANKPVIIKGCSKKPVPQNAYLMAVSKIQAVAKSIFYGEACSSVPLFKSPKK